MSKDHLERSPRLYLSEIIFYIEKIEKFTRDLTKEEFLKDEVKVYAVDDLMRNIGKLKTCGLRKKMENLSKDLN